MHLNMNHIVIFVLNWIGLGLIWIKLDSYKLLNRFSNVKATFRLNTHGTRVEVNKIKAYSLKKNTRLQNNTCIF